MEKSLSYKLIQLVCFLTTVFVNPLLSQANQTSELCSQKSANQCSAIMLCLEEKRCYRLWHTAYNNPEKLDKKKSLHAIKKACYQKKIGDFCYIFATHQMLQPQKRIVKQTRENTLHMHPSMHHACELQKPDACLTIGIYLLISKNKIKQQKAIKYLLRGCRLLCPKSCFVLAKYMKAQNIQINQRTYLHFIKKSCSLDHQPACNAALQYYQNHCYSKVCKKYLHYYTNRVIKSHRRKCRKGARVSCFKIGLLLFK